MADEKTYRTLKITEIHLIEEDRKFAPEDKKPSKFKYLSFTTEDGRIFALSNMPFAKLERIL